jgi:hypothetical protein
MGFLGRLFGKAKVQPVTNERKVEPVKINNRNVRNLFNRRSLTKEPNKREVSDAYYQHFQDKIRKTSKSALERSAYAILEKLNDKNSWDKVLSESDFQQLFSHNLVNNDDWTLSTVNPGDWETNDLNPNKLILKTNKIYRQILTPDEQREYEIVKGLREQVKNLPISEEVYDKLVHYDSIIPFQWHKYTETGKTMYKRLKKASELKENDPTCWETSDKKYLGKFKGKHEEFPRNYNPYYGSTDTYYLFEKDKIADGIITSTECEVQNQNQDPAPVSERRKSRRSKARKMRRTRKSRRCAFA